MVRGGLGCIRGGGVRVLGWGENKYRNFGGMRTCFCCVCGRQIADSSPYCKRIWEMCKVNERKYGNYENYGKFLLHNQMRVGLGCFLY